MAIKARPTSYFVGLLLTLVLMTAAIASRAGDAASKEQYRRPHTIPAPSYNPLTAEKVALGKTLFFDTRLSRQKICPVLPVMFQINVGQMEGFDPLA